MANIKGLLQGYFDSRAARFYLDCQSGKYELPPIEVGREKQLFNIGETVFTSGTGIYKAGIKVTIDEVIEQNGYFRYRCGKLIHRQIDLRR